MGKGADARCLDVGGGDSCLDELLAVDARQVEVPLVVPYGCLGKVESGIGKLVVDLLAHFKMVYRDTRADDGMQFGWVDVEGSM